jgi:hypothetical protein
MVMKRYWILVVFLLLGACLPVTVPSFPTDTPTSPPSPSATLEWFPPTSTSEIIPTAENISTQAVFSELGEVLFRDDFIDAEQWVVPQTDRGQVNISNGEANIIINEPKSYLMGTLEKPDLTTFYVEITANPVLCSGKDEYGLLFRVFGRNQFYRYALTCNGELRLDKITAAGGTVLYPSTRSATVPVGAPSISKIAVVAERDQLHLFINGVYQTSVADQQLLVGSFGIYARSAGDTAMTVSFSDLIVRELLEK